MPAKKPENMTFEETLKAIETIVNELENGHLSLDVSLKQFERGIALARQAQKKLSDAEQRVDILLAQDEHTPLTPFDDTRDE